MRMINWLRRSISAIGLAVLAGCATAPALDAAPRGARPAMWKVSDADTTIYLFGTIHLLPPNTAWRTPVLDQALARSDGLVVETMLDESDPRALLAELTRVGLRDGLPPILDRVSPAKRPSLAAAITKTGIPLAMFNRMESWAAAFTLLGAQFRTLGLSGGEGVESSLRKTFASAGKPVGQLETNAQQLGMFDQLSEPAQRVLLESSIDQPGGAKIQFDQMLNSWTSGDVSGIARSFNDQMGTSPELLETLLARRNASWASWVEQRLASPGTVMLAVGAGHLAGNQSLQRHLARRGVRSDRIQ